MKLSRFFVNTEVAAVGRVVLDDAELAHQLGHVLHFSTGDTVAVFGVNAREWLGRIIEIKKKQVILDLVNEIENSAEARQKIIICQSIIKKDNFESVVQKGTEAGAYGFQPVLADRCEKKDLNFERLEKIAKEATEQSGRVVIPKIFQIQKLDKALAAFQGFKIIFDKSGEPLSAVLSEVRGAELIELYVGPEGGWTDAELRLAREKGARVVNLGPRILRSETAGAMAVFHISQVII